MRTIIHEGLPPVTWTPLFIKNPNRRWWQFWKPRFVTNPKALLPLFTDKDRILDGMIYREIDDADFR